MTQQSSNPMFELQALVGQNFMTILQEINGIGVTGFLELIDTLTEDELRLLAQAGDTVYNLIQKFKTRPKSGG